MAEELNEGPSFERVKELNIHCQAPLLQGPTEKTFADPAMAVKLLGEEKGRFASVLAHRVYTLFRAAFSRNSARLQEVADQWLEAAMAGEEEFVATLTEASGGSAPTFTGRKPPRASTPAEPHGPA